MRAALPIVSRSLSDGSNEWGSPPAGTTVCTSASPSQATLLTTSAQIVVVATTVGTPFDGSVVSSDPHAEVTSARATSDEMAVRDDM